MRFYYVKITPERFKSHFEKIGQITDAKLKYTKDGKFRKFGFIGYKSEEEANKAIDYFNNTFINATKICVRFNLNHQKINLFFFLINSLIVS